MSTIDLNKQNYKYQAVIFDLDGTLMYTLEDLYLSVNYALRQFNLPERTFEEIRCFVGNGVKVLIDKACPKDFNQKEELTQVYKKRYEETALDHIKVYEGIIELLKELHHMGIKTAIETNKFQTAVDEIYDKFFDGLIDVCVGEMPPFRRKPYPDMTLKTLELLGTNKDNTLYVGDSETDVETAKNGDLYCLSCTWGFRTKKELLDGGAYHLIDKPREIINFIKENK